MSFSSGTFSLVAGNPFVSGTVISSTVMNNTMSDLATGLSTCLLKDGSQTVTANIPMSTFRFTGVGNPVNLQDLMTVKSFQNSTPILLATVAGTNTITATASPVPSAYAAGQVFWFTVAVTNTSTVTINISSLGAQAITKNGTTALAAGDLTAGALVAIAYDGTRFQLISGAGSTSLSSLTAASTSNSINNGDNAQAWNWALTTASKSAFKFTENTAATNGVGAQYLLDVSTLAASTAEPFRVATRGGADNLIVTRLGAITLTGSTGTVGSGTTGSAISLTGGAGATANAGGAVSLTGGAGTTSGTGGNATLQAGDGGNVGLAGILNITGGVSSLAQSGNSGGIVMTAGAAGAVASVAGGPILITAGAGSTTTTGGVGGAVTIKSGAGGLALGSGVLDIASGQGGATGPSGNVSFKSGPGGGTSGASGTVTIASGTTTSGGTGAVSLSSGNVGASASSGATTVSTGTGTVSTGTLTLSTGTASSGTAGAINITVGGAASGAGTAITLTAGNGAGGTNGGGNINLIPGTAVSTGTPGEIQINSAAGVFEAKWDQFLPANAPVTATSYPMFLADRAYRVKAARVYQSSAVTPTVDVFKDTGTNAPGAGTSVLTGVITFGAANTVVAGTVTSTIATATLAAGDRLSLKWGGTIGALTGAVVSVLLVPV